MRFKTLRDRGLLNELAASTAKRVAAAAPPATGGIIVIVIACNEIGSTIAVEGSRKISTEELISKMSAQVDELRASLGKSSIIEPS